MSGASARTATIEPRAGEGPPMMRDALLSYAHFFGAFVLFGALFGQALMIRQPPGPAMVRLIARLDMVFGLSALWMIAAGVSRVLWGAKGPDYYAAQPFFAAKMAVFVLIGLVSIWPSLKFRAWARALKADGAFAPAAGEVKSIRTLITAELFLFALLPLFAALMARGLS